MQRSNDRFHVMKAAGLALVLAGATAVGACGDSGDSGDGGDGGAGSSTTTAANPNTTTTTGGGASCQNACDYSFANCPGEFQGTKDACVSGCQQGQPASCVECLAHSCIAGCLTACGGPGITTGAGNPTTTSGDPATTASSSTGGTPVCATGKPLDPSIGTECILNDDCPTNACDNNTPNALNSYCTQSCHDISDCPCDDGGHVWSCELNPKLGAVVKYCIDQSKY